ncbi:MAG: hypothetical protein RLZZ241_2167 [Bacteroidota bacterium]|jgi:hypothetical protein
MKKLIFGVGVLAIMASCTNEPNGGNGQTLTATALSQTLDKLYLDEDLSAMIQSTDLSFNGAGKSNILSTGKTGLEALLEQHKYHGGEGHGRHHFDGDEYGSCAVVDIDTLANTKTIDFGEGCTDRRGVTRSGKIVISYSESRDTVGSFRQVEFVNFFKDSINVQGTRRTEITAIDSLGNFTTTTTQVGGRLVYQDTIVLRTKESTMIRYSYKDPNDRSLNYTTLEGDETGTTADGIEYALTISTPLKFVRNCAELLCNPENDEADKGGKHKHRRYGWKIPVEGIMEITSGENTLTIDFGDGTCDMLADVTTNGVTETVDISTLTANDEFKNLFQFRGR